VQQHLLAKLGGCDSSCSQTQPSALISWVIAIHCQKVPLDLLAWKDSSQHFSKEEACLRE
jgi:hypothetical protein